MLQDFKGIKVIGIGQKGHNAISYFREKKLLNDSQIFEIKVDAASLKKFFAIDSMNSKISKKLLEEFENKRISLDKYSSHYNKAFGELIGEDTEVIFFIGDLSEEESLIFTSLFSEGVKKQNVFTIALFSFPLSSEGSKKLTNAIDGIKFLDDKVDSLIILSDDNLSKAFDHLTKTEVVRLSNTILFEVVKSLGRITSNSKENITLRDLESLLTGSGTAVIGISEAKGKNRAFEVARKAISAPFMDEKDVEGASKVLLNIISGNRAELEIDELTEITEYIQEKLGNESEVIFAHEVDASLGEKIRLVIIVTGLKNRILPSLNIDVSEIENKIKYITTPNTDSETLSLLFLEEEYSKEEIAELISFLSDIYRELGGDKLVIKGTNVFEFTPVLEPNRF